MALAKLGTTDTWSEIAQPPRPTARARQQHHLRPGQLGPAGTWPAIHDHLDQLLQVFRTKPPSINYPRRRVLACDLDLIDRALGETADVHPSPLPDAQLRRVFWEAFSGGIAYTHDHFALDPDSPAYSAYRADAADSLDRDLPRLQVAHQQISHYLGETSDPSPGPHAPDAPTPPT